MHTLRVGAALEARRRLLLLPPQPWQLGATSHAHTAAEAATGGHRARSAGAHSPRAAAPRSERVSTLLARVADGQNAAPLHFRAASPDDEDGQRSRSRRGVREARSRARGSAQHTAASGGLHGSAPAIQRQRRASAAAARASSPSRRAHFEAASLGQAGSHVGRRGRLSVLARAVRLMRMHAYERELTTKLRVRDRRRQMRTTHCS